MKKENMHILMIRLSAMGDVAISVPILKAIVTQHPKVKITILSTLFYKPFFNNIPNISFFAIDKKGKHKGILGLFKLAKELSKLSINSVADTHNVLRSNILVHLLQIRGIPYKQINKGRIEKKALTRKKNKIFIPLKSSHQRYADVFRALGLTIDLSKKTEKSSKEISKKTIQLIGKTNKQKIGIAPFATHLGKEYPLKKMEQVIDRLSKKYQILLFGGGKTEAKKLNTLAHKYSNTINTIGHLSFKEELALISNLDLMVSMDSGNGHLAAMYGIPVITIWGVTHPYAGFAPFQQPKENQITPNLKKFPLIPTSVYGNKYPKGYLNCFNSIVPEQIIKKINTILEK